MRDEGSLKTEFHVFGLIRVLHFQHDARTLAAVKMDGLEHVYRLAAKLRQGFERVFRRLQCGSIGEQVGRCLGRGGFA